MKMKSNYANTIRAPLRLIGLEREYELIEEELKGCTARFDVNDDLTFLIGQKRTRVHPEELLIALMGKIRKILLDHRMTSEFIYVSVPSFLSQHERRIIKRCA
jgi:heat shock 70kDa protein 4